MGAIRATDKAESLSFLNTESIEEVKVLRTLEMRWFKQGEIPLAISRWFNQDCPGKRVQEAESRIDWYLQPIAPCDNLNIKFRQGRLEVKWREQQFPPVALAQQGQGRVEQWVKWLCEAESMQDFLPQDPAWVAVEKARLQRQFVLSPEAFCNVELTQLRVQEQNWWTFGLESTGDQDSLYQIVWEVGQNCPETFTKEDAAAYPHWLAQQFGQNSQN